MANTTARAGSIIETLIPNGMGRNGQEWKKVRAKVYIVSPNHVAARILGTSGARPIVADTYTVVRY